MSPLIEQTKHLYQIVDQKDVHALIWHCMMTCRSFSNAAPVVGKPAVEAVKYSVLWINWINDTYVFWDLRKRWYGCDVVRVDYVRLNGSAHAAKFATFLSFKQGLIHQYKIFADVSELLARQTLSKHVCPIENLRASNLLRFRCQTVSSQRYWPFQSVIKCLNALF